MKPKYLFITLLICFSCKQENSERLLIDPGRWKESKIKLSDIADDISYIPFDNAYPFQAQVIARPEITQKYILIFIGGIPGTSSTTGLVKYDRNGKLICKIGSYGRGPEEYMSNRFTCDNETGEVYILNNGDKIKIYSNAGNFLREISLGKFGKFSRIELYNRNLFAFDFPGNGKSKFNWIVFDTLGGIVKIKKNSLHPFANPFISFTGSIYKYDYRLFYWNTYNDTVFSISNDLSTNTAILFAQGPHRWPASDLVPSESNDLSQVMRNHLMPIYIFETHRFIVFYYFYQDQYPVVLIEKQNGEGHIIERDNTLNDIDGGIMFPLMYSHYLVEDGNEYIAGFIESNNLRAHVASEAFQDSNPKYPEKKKALVKLANSLKVTDNPILMVVKLRN